MKKFTLLVLFFASIQLTIYAQPIRFNANGTSSSSLNAVMYSTNELNHTVEISATKRPIKDYEYYMHQRSNRKTIGWVLLGSGFASTGLAALLGASNNRQNNTGPATGSLLLIGAATGLASIPFMILAGSSYNKAKLILENKKTGFGIPGKADQNVTGFSLAISIGK